MTKAGAKVPASVLCPRGGLPSSHVNEPVLATTIRHAVAVTLGWR